MRILASITLIILIFVLVVLNADFQLSSLHASTIDGWLGFFGGLFGGYLAFISAYYIYRKQRHDSVRPIIVVESAHDFCSDMLHVIHRDIGVNEIPIKNTKQVPIRIKNIGSGAAIDIECDCTSHYKLFHSLPDGYGNEIQEAFVFYGIASAESEVRDLLIQLPSIEDHASPIVDFTLAYKGIYGQSYIVSVQVIIESTNRISSEIMVRTIKRT